MKYYKSIFYILLFFLFQNCSTEYKKEKTLFSKISSKESNILFKNSVKENLYFNFLNYSYIYNGGGVAIGDINNDGLEDIYFTSNQKSNKLFLNKGNLKFDDITETAKVKDQNGWTTGVTMIDINNDGWLDIYVCKSGSLQSHQERKNKLFINQKNNTFKESAKEYGIDHYGFSVQAYFFDYDKDGDLDMYLVNHRQDFRNNVNIDQKIQLNKEDYNSDQLFRNDNNKFTNVTKLAGITNKAWGLSASIGDFNNDNLLDIYVANDFLEPDFLYINQGNGTFKDQALKHFNHISSNSMGSDFMDLNNDSYPDLVVLDMMAEDHIRSKENMATMSIENFNTLVKIGYHHQYMTNVLQLNNGNGMFSEIAQLSGISKTDWSWAPLIADFDNDGFNDIYITNGIENDLSNQDFRNQIKSNIRNRKKISLDQAIDLMPSTKLSNYTFKNNKNLTFTNKSKEWGLDFKVNSNGASYADLDNDGDLDLIVNNQSDLAHIYKNNSNQNYLKVKLKGSEKNINGIGTKVTVFTKETKQTKKLFISRGYQSSVSNILHFGLSNSSKIDSLIVYWQNGKQQKILNPKINSLLELAYSNTTKNHQTKTTKSSLFTKINPKELGINFTHKENNFDDFNLQLLLPQKQSEFSKTIAVADINNDGLQDLYLGNSKDQKASMYIQNQNGTFKEINSGIFIKDKGFEDTSAVFLDVDNDNDLDLYVTSGGYEISEDNNLLQDRLYINNGYGNFIKGKLPKIRKNSSHVTVSDFDKDGDVDIFVSTRVKHGKYPLSDSPYLLENNNGTFKNVTNEKFDTLENVKIINQSIFADYDNDGDDDLILVGEWMPITFYKNEKGKFIHQKINQISNINGWFQSIKTIDINNDNKLDFLIGNWGNNNKFKPTNKKPLHIYSNYFDNNNSYDIALSKVSKNGTLLPVRGKECSTQQTPFLAKKIKSYKEFAASNMTDIYGDKNIKGATHYFANNFNSLIIINKGNNIFEKINLPINAQMSPTLDFEIMDINNDGFMDIFGIGNIYDAEVETVRYDASKGYVLINNQKGEFDYYNSPNYLNNKETKAIRKIIIKNKTHFILLNKNSEITLIKAEFN